MFILKKSDFGMEKIVFLDMLLMKKVFKMDEEKVRVNQG